jgi:hypothetical protein
VPSILTLASVFCYTITEDIHLLNVLYIYILLRQACERISNVVSDWNGGLHVQYHIPISQTISTWSGRLVFEHSVRELDVCIINIYAAISTQQVLAF